MNCPYFNKQFYYLQLRVITNFWHKCRVEGCIKNSSIAKARYPDFVLLLSSQMRSQFICFETVPKIVTLADHWVQFNSLNSVWQQLLLLLSVISKDLGWNFFKNHNKLCYDFFFLVGYYQTHFCFCETLSKTSSSK